MVSGYVGGMSPAVPPTIALIVIDVQRGFDEWEDAGRRRNNPDALTRIADLLAAFRAKGVPIFHVRHESTQPGSSFAPDRTGYLVKDEAREREGEPVIVKRVNSAFIGTDLEARLRALGLSLHPHPATLPTGEKRAARKNLRNVADTDAGDAGRACQQNSRSELGQKSSGSPGRIRTTARDLPVTWPDSAGLSQFPGRTVTTTGSESCAVPSERTSTTCVPAGSVSGTCA